MLLYNTNIFANGFWRLMWEGTMPFYQCPNCGRIYNDNKLFYCLNCNNRLIKQEDVKKIKHPELSRNDHHVIGTVTDTTKLLIECPYCHSTNTKKISGLSKAGSVALFGIFALGKTSKQWHCNNCNSDF